MNNPYQSNENDANHSGNFFAGFLIGSLFGAVVMLFIAPQPGRETREKLLRKGSELRDQMVEKGSDLRDQVVVKGSELRDQMVEKSSELRDQVVEIGGNVVAQAGEKTRMTGVALEQAGQELKEHSQALSDQQKKPGLSHGEVEKPAHPKSQD